MDHGSVMVILINSKIQGFIMNNIIYINKYNKKYLKIFIKLPVCRCFLMVLLVDSGFWQVQVPTLYRKIRMKN
jgi:hypothetical protein